MMPRVVSRVLVDQWPRMLLALRGSAAALASLAIATYLQVENPYWAAMTALIVIQPTRSQLLEKSFYRLVGTVIGSAAAVLFMLHPMSPALLTVVLSLWVAGCVGAGNLLYGLRSYAMLMASCTCVVITMSAYHFPAHIHQIAFGRVAGIMIGIMTATATTAAFTPSHTGAKLNERLRALTRQTVEWLALLVREGRSIPLRLREGDILIELAELEQQLETLGLGNKRLKSQKRQAQSLIGSLLSLIAVGRLAGEQLSQHHALDHGHRHWRGLLASHLECAADGLQQGGSTDLTGMAAVAAETREHLPLLGSTLSDIVNALRPVLDDCCGRTTAGNSVLNKRLAPYRDWREAGRSALRAGVVFASIGCTWALTGWSKGPLLLMALAIMVSIFSTKDHPVHFMGNIFIGAAIGSAAAVFCRSFLLADNASTLETCAILAPFLLAGVLAMQHRRTVLAATDATLFFLFISQAGVPIVLAAADMAIGAVAAVLGVGSAWIAYRYLVPINPDLRMRSLSRALFQDLARLAAGMPEAEAVRVRARLRYRVVRLVALACRHDSDHAAMARAGITALGASAGIERLREELAKGSHSRARVACVHETLASLAALPQHPDRAAQLLDQAARALRALQQPEQGTQRVPLPLPGPAASGLAGRVACCTR